MKLRNLSILLFAAACGGGGGDGPKPVDAMNPDGGGGFFPNSRNDVFYTTFEGTLAFDLTPDEGDKPDNDPDAFQIGQSGGTGIHGEFGIAGDQSDAYKERDTYLITTGGMVNQLTVRMDWDGAADMDWLVFGPPEDIDGDGDVDADDLILVEKGTAISDGINDAAGGAANEFVTFVVPPNQDLLLWGGIFAELNAGGDPALPQEYDLSVYGENVTPANQPACGFTEANDAGNNGITRFGGTGARENSGLSLASTVVYCGTLTPKTPVPDPVTAEVQTEEVDSFTLNVPIAGDFIITVIGQTEADQTAINALIEKGSLQAGVTNERCTVANCPDVDPNTQGVQKRQEQFWGLATDNGSHGVDAFTAEDSTFDPPEASGDPNVADIQGPTGVSIFVRSLVADGASLTTPINYKIIVSPDNRNTRAARKTGDKVEAHDN